MLIQYPDPVFLGTKKKVNFKGHDNENESPARISSTGGFEYADQISKSINHNIRHKRASTIVRY